MAKEIQMGIRITADGQAAVVEAGNVKRALDGIGKGAEDVAGKAGQVREGLTSISGGVRTLTALSIGTLGFNVAIELANRLRESLFNLPSVAREFTATMETNQLGMAGILASMTTMNGRATDFGQAMTLSSDMMGKLNQDAMRTAASTGELVNAYRALLGPGMAANMSLEQIRQLTVTGVNAVKAMGMPAQQVVQELKDLVAGGITAASSTLATALGLRDEDIAKAKASAEGLFVFLMKRLAGMGMAADRYSETISGVASAMQEKLTLSAATGFASLTQAGKESMKTLSEIVSSKGFVEALTAVSDALVYMGFMAKAAFSVLKELLLSAALVAGGYAIGAAIAAINAAAVLSAGGVVLLNKELLMFATGAALQKLSALGAAGKGGLLGLALYGGWELGTFANSFEVIRAGVQKALDPVFRFFDRTDVTMLDKLNATLEKLRSGAGLKGGLAFDQAMPEKDRLAQMQDTERQIAEIRKRMNLDAPPRPTGGAAPALGLNVGILEGEYQKLIATQKTATGVQKEYTEALNASRKQFEVLIAAKKAAGAGDAELAALRTTQDQFESAIAAKRSNELRSIGAEARGLAEQRAAAALKLAEIEGKATAEQLDADLKLGLITREQHDARRLAIDLETLAAKKAREQDALGIGTLSAVERQRHRDTILEIDAQMAARARAHGNNEAIERDKLLAAQAQTDASASAETVNRQLNQIAALKKGNDAIREHNAQIGETTEQVLLLKAAEEEAAILRLEHDIASQEEDARQAGLAGGSPATERLKEEIALLRERQGLQRQGAVLEAADAQGKKFAEDFKRNTDNIERALADSVMRGFEKGKSFMQNFKDSLINAFKTTVLQPVIQAIVRPAAQAIGGVVSGITGSLFSGSAGAARGFGLSDVSTGWGWAALAAMAVLSMSGDGGGPKNSEAWLQGGPGGYNIGINNAAGGDPDMNQVRALNAALNDSSKFAPAVLAGLVGTTVNTGAPADTATLIQQLTSALSAAAQSAQNLAQKQQNLAAAQQNETVMTASLQSAMQGLSSKLGIDALTGARQALAISDYNAPLERVKNAQDILDATYRAALGGDLNAVQAFPQQLQDALSVARDAFASGPQFQQIMADDNAKLNDLLARQQATQADLLKDVPLTIQQAANDQISALKTGFAQMVDTLNKLRADIRARQA